MSHWSDILNPHLRERIKLLSDEDWVDIERVGHITALQNGLPLIIAEANSLLALLNAKEKGQFTRLLN